MPASSAVFSSDVQCLTVCYFSSVCNALSNRSVVFTRTKINSEFNYNIKYISLLKFN